MDFSALFDLAKFVSEHLAVKPCSHTFGLTEEWLLPRGEIAAGVLYWLEEHGARCDHEVVAFAQKMESAIETEITRWQRTKN